jgi:hypothetical protein
MTGGPLKPAFGESGAVLQLNKVFRRLFRAFAPSVPTRPPPAVSRCVVPKTDPLPIFRTFAESCRHRITMNVAKLLHKLRVISSVEIVGSLLPEMLFPTQAKCGLEWVTLSCFTRPPKIVTHDQAENEPARAHRALQRTADLRFSDARVVAYRHFNHAVSRDGAF